MKNLKKALSHATATFVLISCLTNISYAQPNFSLGATMKPTQAPRARRYQLPFLQATKDLALSRDELFRIKAEIEQEYEAFNKKYPAPRRETVRDPAPLTAKYEFISGQFNNIVDSVTRVDNQKKAEVLTHFQSLYFSPLRHVLMQKIIDFLITYTEDTNTSDKRMRLKNNMETTRSRLLQEATWSSAPGENIQSSIFKFTQGMSSVIIPALTRSFLGRLRAYVGYKGIAGLPLMTVAAIAAFVKRKEIADYVTARAVKPLKDWLEKETLSETILITLSDEQFEEKAKKLFIAQMRATQEYRISLRKEIRKLEAQAKLSDKEVATLEDMKNELAYLQTPVAKQAVQAAVKEMVKQMGDTQAVEAMAKGGFTAIKKYGEEAQKRAEEGEKQGAVLQES